MTKDTRIEGTSVILMRWKRKLEDAIFIFSPFFFSSHFACVLSPFSSFFFLFFRLILVAWSRPTRFFFFTRNYAFLSVFLFWDSKRVSKEFRLLFALFQSLCAHPPFTARGAIVWSDNGIFYWIPVNTYPPLTASIVLRLISLRIFFVI